MLGRGRARKRIREEAPAVRIDDDFHGWLLDQASALRDQRYGALDWKGLGTSKEKITGLLAQFGLEALRV